MGGGAWFRVPPPAHNPQNPPHPTPMLWVLRFLDPPPTMLCVPGLALMIACACAQIHRALCVRVFMVCVHGMRVCVRHAYVNWTHTQTHRGGGGYPGTMW